MRPNGFRPTVALAALATGLLLVAGCGTAGHRDSSNSAPAAAPSAAKGLTQAKSPAQFKGGTPDAPPPTDQSRDIVRTASLILDTPDPVGSADKATVIVDKAGGRVDQRSDDAGSTTGHARVGLTLRVPSSGLDAALASLKGLGNVETLEIKTDDVTTQRVDLDARITALQTSVDRLLAIMRDAKDPDALIKAEDALSQRQADLQSLQAQRNALRDQISYSSVDLQLIASAPGGPAPQRYHGFTGQVERGWDTLWACASQLVLLFGFMLPWLSVVAVIGVLAYVLHRVLRARRAGRPEPVPTPVPPSSPE